MADRSRTLLLISGSTRADSINTAVLRTVQAVQHDAASTVLFDRLVEFPAFNADDDHDPPPPLVAELRAQIAAADAVLFCTPEYAGTLPGSFKNLLDWTVGGGEMDRKPVAWINVAADGRGAGADATLAVVLGYLGAEIVVEACRHLPIDRTGLAADGTVADPRIRASLQAAMRALLQHESRAR